FLTLWAGLKSAAAGMPKSHADPGQEFAGAKRLGEIVVGAVVQRLDLLLLLISNGKNDNRRSQPFAKPAQDLLTIHIGQAQIENYQVRGLLGGQTHALVPSLGFVQSITFCHQGSSQE